MKIEVKQDTILLNFVRNYFNDISVTKAKKMILYNCFSMQGASLKSPEYILHKGDIIEYRKYYGGEHIIREKRNISILYEDRDIIIVNKLSGQSVIEYRDRKEETLLSLTKNYLKKKYHKNDLFVIFAPQTDESGLVLFAKNKLVADWFSHQTNNFKFSISAVIENSLKHKNDKIQFAVTDKNGIFSIAKEEDPKENIKEVFLQYSTIADLSSDNNNYFQIDIKGNGFQPYLNRFLLSHIGNPVYGDNVFQYKKQGNKILRYCVYGMEFLRPSTNKKVRIEVLLPRNFTSIAVAPINVKEIKS